MTSRSRNPFKQCSVCAQSFPKTKKYFYVSRHTPDGPVLMPRCKECHRAKERVRYQPGSRVDARLRARARMRAFTRLANIYPETWEKVYQQEVKRAWEEAHGAVAPDPILDALTKRDQDD